MAHDERVLGGVVLDDEERVRRPDRGGRALARAVQRDLRVGAERALAVHADLEAAVDLLLVLALERDAGRHRGADRLVGGVELRAAGEGEARGAVLERDEVGVDLVARLRERQLLAERGAVDHAGGLGVEVDRDDAVADGDDAAVDVFAGLESGARGGGAALVFLEEGVHLGRPAVLLGLEHGMRWRGVRKTRRV